MPRVILTSFEPFGGHGLNSSLEVGRLVVRRPPRGVHLEWVVLPVVAWECVERAWACVERAAPDLVLSLGQIAGAARVRVEAAAVNRNHFSMRDNAGNFLREQPTVPGGPPVYGATVPLEDVLAELRGAGVPAELSRSAGAFVCNHLFYGLLHRADRDRTAHRTGFLHLPLLPEQVKPGRRTPSCGLEPMAEGVRRAIRACLAAARLPARLE